MTSYKVEGKFLKGTQRQLRKTYFYFDLPLYNIKAPSILNFIFALYRFISIKDYLMIDEI